MAVERAIEIAASPEEVFAFLADARNDPSWCATVKSCRLEGGEGGGEGARYLALHRPTPFHRVMPRTIEVLEYEHPRLIRWRQEDSNGVFDITYRVEPGESGTRFVQSDAIDWKISPAAARVAERLFVRRHIGQQMAHLKSRLEAGRM
jgi:uncharacterized protein YndB with AHSA1/START domain